jgi:ATP-dependent Zn protease
MNRSPRVLVRTVAVLCVVTSLLCGSAFAAAPAASESEAAFNQQLAAKHVKSVVINKYGRSMRVTLNDGTQVITRYPKKQSEQTAKHIRAAGVTVTFLSEKQGLREVNKGKKPHHKIRYIAGGVLIVLILLVGGVLLFRRRGSRD